MNSKPDNKVHIINSFRVSFLDDRESFPPHLAWEIGGSLYHRTTSIDLNIINVISCNNNDNKCNCVEAKKKDKKKSSLPQLIRKWESLREI